MVISPEYNHTIPPALTTLMNMVGCSKYANKVSGSVCYSGFSSPAGGARCAVALRPYLSELGCLPVSKQVILPDANKTLSEEGVPQGAHAEGAQKLMTAMLEQCVPRASSLSSKPTHRRHPRLPRLPHATRHHATHPPRRLRWWAEAARTQRSK